MTVRAGFIGLGIMGKPMARWLIEKGLETHVYDIAEAPVDELVALGAKRAASPARAWPRTVTSSAYAFATMQRFAKSSLATTAFSAVSSCGTTFAIHSTVYTETVLEAGAAAEKLGKQVLDAPVTGGPMAAEAGTLTYMIGGSQEAFDKYRPALETSAKTIVYTGPLGTATYTKICNNLLQYIAFLGVQESFTLLRHLGVRKEALEEVTKSNGLLNESCGAYMAGVVSMDDETVSSQMMQDYMRGRLAIAEKDLAIALQEARRVGYAMPGTALVSQLMSRVYRVDDPQKR